MNTINQLKYYQEYITLGATYALTLMHYRKHRSGMVSRCLTQPCTLLASQLLPCAVRPYYICHGALTSISRTLRETIKAKINAIFTIQHRKCVWSAAVLQYSTARCEKRIVNDETRWCIQVNSAKISLLTETFVQDIIQNRLTQDDKVDRQVIFETGKL